MSAHRDARPAGAPAPGTDLGAWHRAVAHVLRVAYFGRVRVTGQRGTRQRARLILASHRSGAIDGTQVQAAFPRAQYLVSLQMLRNPFLRLFFTGIPVVRERDIERYGMDRSTVADAVTAGVRHLAAGGDLVVFPEGSSEWSYRPLPYKTGAARMWAALRAQGIEIDVVPLGLFYSAPDKFASLAALHVGDPVAIDADADVDRVHETMSRALDAVSVNCPDAPTFDRVQVAATARARAGEPFSLAFLGEQASGAQAADATASGGGVRRAVRWAGLALLWLFWPVLAVAWWAGRKADARNTVALFRMLAGVGAALLWLAVVAGAVTVAIVAGHAVAATVVLGAGLLSALAGHAILTSPRWQPDPDPIASRSHRIQGEP